MIKETQETLDTVPTGAIVAFFQQGEHRVHMKAYPIIKEFDGVLCDFEFPKGGGYFTVLPVSTGKYLDVSITIMDGWVEYEITDDWGDEYYLYIRSSEGEIIFKSILSYKEKYGIIPTLK